VGKVIAAASVGLLIHPLKFITIAINTLTTTSR
jgi:hypothetical protein